jgi:hypothetical protein
MVSIIIGNALNLETEKVKKKFDLEGWEEEKEEIDEAVKEQRANHLKFMESLGISDFEISTIDITSKE